MRPDARDIAQALDLDVTWVLAVEELRSGRIIVDQGEDLHARRSRPRYVVLPGAHDAGRAPLAYCETMRAARDVVCGPERADDPEDKSDVDHVRGLEVAVRALYAAGWRLTLGGGEMVDRLALVHVDTHERRSVWSAAGEEPVR